MSLVKDLHPLRHELESSRSAIPVMWRSPSDQTEDDGRLTRERRMRSWVHRVLKEDLGEKVTEAEWTRRSASLMSCCAATALASRAGSSPVRFTMCPL